MLALFKYLKMSRTLFYRFQIRSLMHVTTNFIQRQQEELHNKIIKLEKDLDAKQNLELQIEHQRGKLNVLRSMGDDGDAQVLEKVDTMLKGLREKEDELEDLEALNQTLIVKERKSNDELQEARKELINVSFFFNIYFIFCLNGNLFLYIRHLVFQMVLREFGSKLV